MIRQAENFGHLGIVTLILNIICSGVAMRSLYLTQIVSHRSIYTPHAPVCLVYPPVWLVNPAYDGSLNAFPLCTMFVGLTIGYLYSSGIWWNVNIILHSTC